MEKVPQFIRKFSKEKFPKERQKMAGDIRAKRMKHFETQRDIIQQENKSAHDLNAHERQLIDQLNNVEGLTKEIADLSQSRLTQLLHYFEVKKLRADLVGGQKTYDELMIQKDTILEKEKLIPQQSTIEETQSSMKEAQNMLDGFYIDQKEKWVESDYTKKDITENFSEEHLVSLSTEDYALLLKRFPCEMVAHVTRQGIRDHVGHMFHMAGQGEYSDGFMKIVEDGHLRSPLGVYLVEEEKDQAIEKFLDLDRFPTKLEATAYLDKFTKKDQGDAGSYSDRMAIHFATEEVADAYYGSEKGNEIFIAYPSAYIASQYYFNGDLKSSGGGYWNDQWVWTNEDRGMDLDAGLVFIPESARVDINTGSRYELDHDKNPIPDKQLTESIQEIIDSPDFFAFAKQAYEILGKFSDSDTYEYIYSHNTEAKEILEPFRLQLIEKFDITDRRAHRAILNYNFLFGLCVTKKHDDNEEYARKSKSLMRESLKTRGILFIEAKNPISSKEFWEKYFAQHPGQKPSKIVYYKGEDPTEALDQWKKDQGIKKRINDATIGFPERRISRDDTRATDGLDRFRSIAEEVIDKHFQDKERV
ncbi:MAG: hypothetical protein Q8P11_02130 [bacterium]|nr:hypothetical protein [bacterium]